ncbi:hypothetical protein RIF29_27071 [Crotalaria pallida]|uniref:Uncharacterized protein n=1 Tax=Crotalaria pallida TaxID=3830 RepID=A0AAN9ENE8_CROPI
MLDLTICTSKHTHNKEIVSLSLSLSLSLLFPSLHILRVSLSLESRFRIPAPPILSLSFPFSIPFQLTGSTRPRFTHSEFCYLVLCLLKTLPFLFSNFTVQVKVKFRVFLVFLFLGLS